MADDDGHSEEEGYNGHSWATEDASAETLVDQFRGRDEKDGAEVVGELKRAWVGEVCSPELLTYKGEVVASTLQRLKSMERRLDEFKTQGSQEMFTASLYQMELDRQRYAVAKYLRTRWLKIEKDILHVILHSQDMMREGRLSETELEYASLFCDSLEEHLNNLVLGDLPQKFRDLVPPPDGEKMVDEPDLDVFVVCRVRQEIGNIDLGEAGGVMELLKGDEYILRYRLIKDYVMDGRIELI